MDASDVHHAIACTRGAAHPVCFTDMVMERDFPYGFKPVNIVQYDGSTNPYICIEDYTLIFHIEGGDDVHAIKYLPLKLKGSAQH